MYNADGEFVREVKEEKTDEELSELLSGHEAKRCPWWRVVLCVLTIAAVVLMVKTLVDFGEERTKAVRMVMDPMSMMFEEDSSENKAELKFKSEPTHKGYFMQYVLDEWWGDEHSAEELLNMSSEVDPENALYHYLAAGKNSREVVERQRTSSSGMSEEEKFNRVTEYKVLHQDTYGKALEYTIEAGKKDGIVDHSIGVRLEKQNKAKENYPQDYIGRIAMFMAMHDVSFYSMRMLSVSTMLSTKFYELSQNGTEDEVRFWKNEYLKLLDTLLENDGVLVDMLVVKAVMAGSLPNMRAAARQAGMNDDEDKITKLIDVLFLEKEARDKMQGLGIGQSENMTKYSRECFLNALSDAPIKRHLPPNVELDVELDPAPNRLSEHALAGRVLVTLSFALIGVLCIAMWVFYGNKSKEMRVMSHQVLGSLSLLEGVFIVVGGVIFPIVAYVLINEKTALGVREWGITSVAGLLLLLQFCGMLLTMFSLSSVLLRWRLSKHLSEIVKSARWYQWFIPCAAFIAMILVGFSDSKEEMLPWAISLMLLFIACIAWVGISIGQCFFKSDKLARLSLCRGLLSLYAVALIFMVGLSFYYHAQEFKYVAQDESFSLKEEHMGVGVIEFRVAQELRKNLRRQLEIIR